MTQNGETAEVLPPGEPVPQRRRRLGAVLGSLGIGRGAEPAAGPPLDEGYSDVVIDPFAEMLGDLPDELADAWTDFEGLRKDVIEDDEVEGLFTAMVQELDGGQAVGRKARRRQSGSNNDYPRFVTLFHYLARVNSPYAEGFTGAADQFDEQRLSTRAMRDEITLRAEEVAQIVSITQGMFERRATTHGPDSATAGFGRAMHSLSDEAGKLLKPVQKTARKLYRTLDEVLDAGVEGAEWVVNAAAEYPDSQLEGERALALQLISQANDWGETSILTRALTRLERAAIEEFGLMPEYMRDKLGENDGDNQFAFLMRSVGLDEETFIATVQRNIEDIPADLRAEYMSFAKEKLSALRMKVGHRLRNDKSDRGEANLTDAKEESIRLFRKVTGADPVLTVNGKRSVARGAQNGSKTGRVTFTSTPERNLPIKRTIKIARRAEGGFVTEPLGDDTSLAEHISHETGESPDSRVVTDLTAILEDIQTKRRIDGHGIKRLRTGRVRIDGNPANLLSLNPHRYPGIATDTRTKEARVVLHLKGNELVITNVFRTHRDYDRFIRGIPTK